MIELDGIQYNVRTPEENAEDILTFVNTYCSEHNITNSKGELVQIDLNWANPLYLILYGFAYLTTVLQKLIYNAGCALNIARSSPRQLMNLAEIANVKRKEATRTTIHVIIYANNITDPDPVSCHITQDLLVTMTYGSQVITFSPAFETTIAVGSSTPMVLVCNQEGSYSIPAGSITAFDDEVAGLRKIESQASVPGQAQETLSELRARIQERATTSTQLDRAAADITQLNGVSLCNVYFNYSNTASTIVNNIEVPPRQALLFVQGYSPDIARTFYNHLSCLTAGGDAPSTLTQVYTTHAGQNISVHIIPPVVVYPYITIYINTQETADVISGIKDAIATLALNMTIGQTLTSTDIILKIKEVYPTLALAGVQLSIDNESWTYQLEAQPFQLFGFSSDHMLVSEP